MNLHKFLMADASMLAVLIMVILIITVYLKETGISYSSRFFLGLCWSTVAILILEILRWLAQGLPGVSGFRISSSVNFLFLLINPLPATAWLFYIDYLLYDSVDHLKKRWFYLLPMAVCLVLMLLSIKTGLMFSINADNGFERGPGMMLIFVLNYILVIQALVVTFRKRKTSGANVVSIVVLFSLIPAAGAVFQMFFYGISTIWPLTALAVLLTYLFVEIQREIRDYLTGLLTRQQIDNWIRFRIKEYGKKGKFALVIIDMDDFKSINDCYGHEAGDQALVSMAYSLMRTVKRSDKVGRFGGDEFIIVVETDDETIITSVLDRLSERVQQENKISLRPYCLSYSSGYAIYDPEVFDGFKDLFLAADRMMYESKAVKGDPYGEHA